jgi:hypothetical protein
MKQPRTPRHSVKALQSKFFIDSDGRLRSRATGLLVTGRPTPKGYDQIHLEGHFYYIHRLLWTVAKGAWPVEEIDFVDNNPSNVRLDNLREATSAQNGHNRSRSSNNTSGYKGVSWHKGNQAWRAQIRVNGKTHTSYYGTPEAAHAWYCAMASKHYGEFANAG